jgi:ankyrin repeat protein
MPLCKANRPAYTRVPKVLLANGANPNRATTPNVDTDGFMRDCRTKGETPLHRAAAFGTEEAVQLLLDAGAIVRTEPSLEICAAAGAAVRNADKTTTVSLCRIAAP